MGFTQPGFTPFTSLGDLIREDRAAEKKERIAVKANRSKKRNIKKNARKRIRNIRKG